jgi:hypothetical protein
MGSVYLEDVYCYIIQKIGIFANLKLTGRLPAHEDYRAY